MEAQWSHYARVTVGKNLSAHFWHNSQPEHANCPHTLTKLIGASVGSAVGSAVANAHSSSMHICRRPFPCPPPPFLCSQTCRTPLGICLRKAPLVLALGTPPRRRSNQRKMPSRRLFGDPRLLFPFWQTYRTWLDMCPGTVL